MTKKEQIKICQNIRDKYNDGEYLTIEDFNIINSLLKNHRHYKQKKGNMNYRIYVNTVSKYNTRGFFIQREDGTKTDFSFYECIYPTNSFKKDFIKAARAAIADDIIFLKERKFYFTESPKCKICNKSVTIRNSHLDHYPIKFRDILNTFIKKYNIKDFEKLTEPTTWDNRIGVEITDKEIKELWISQHFRNAEYRILCPECNLKLG